MSRIAILLIIIGMLPTVTVGEDRSPPEFKVKLIFNQMSFLQDKPIAGRIRIELPKTNGTTSNSATYDIRRASLHFQFQPADPSLIPTIIISAMSNAPEIMVGKSYDIPFSIDISTGIQSAIPTNLQPISIFSSGHYRLKAILGISHSLVWPAPDAKENTSAFEGEYRSDWDEINIEQTPSHEIALHELVVSVTNSSPATIRAVVQYCIQRNALRTEYITTLLDQRDPYMRSEIMNVLFTSRVPIPELDCFQSVHGPIILKDHASPPIFIRAHPNEQIQCHALIKEMHTLNIIGIKDTVLRPEQNGKRDINILVPSNTGVFKMVCDIHQKTWGWLLVTANK